MQINMCEVMMQKIKILIFIILLSIGFSFNGELYMLYLDNFQESYYQVSFVLDRPSKEVSDAEIIQDFTNAGEKYHVDFYFINNKIQSVNSTDINIYGTENALRHLKAQGIKEGNNRSLFFGEATVHYESFQKIKNISKYDTCYFIGDKTQKKNLDSFKAALIDQYGGGFPRQLGSDQETWLNLLSVWGIIFCLSLIMTLYGVVYQKKETMVRIILGENLNTLFLKNIMIDTVSFLLLFLLISRLLYGYSNVYFKLSFITLLFVIFLIINTLLNATILQVHFKKDLAGGNRGQVLLTSNYVLKVTTTILTILLLSSNVIIIRDGYNLYQQRNFFEKHKEYSYCKLYYKVDNHLGKTDEDDTFMNQKFYQQFQDRSLQYVDLTGNFNSTYPVLLCNRTSMKEILNRWPAIAKAVSGATEEKVYLLLPSNLSTNSKEYDLAMQTGDAFFSEAGYGNIKTILYDPAISIIGIHQFKNYQMKQYKNPILLYNNTLFQTNASLTGHDGYYSEDTMYDISPKEWRTFIQEFQLEDQIVAKSNVLDVYEHSWSLAYRNMKLTLLLSAFLLFLEMALIIFILRLEYQFNAIEMALKKIHGYSLYKRNRKIFTITIFSSLAGTLLALILSRSLGMQGGRPVLLVGLFLLVLELCYIFLKAKKIENSTITSVLKGEKI